MIKLQITPVPSTFQLEHIRQLVGYYRGIANVTTSGLVNIYPKKDFYLHGLLVSLHSLKLKVELVKD